MNIEVGKFYVNRRGQKCLVYKKTNNYFFNIEIETDITSQVNEKGYCYDNDKDSLIEEWKEPEEFFVNIYRNIKNGNITSGKPMGSIDAIFNTDGVLTEDSSTQTWKLIARTKAKEGVFIDE